MRSQGANPCYIVWWELPLCMSAMAKSESRGGGIEATTTTVLTIGRLLTGLRLLTIGCVVIVLTVLAQNGLLLPLPWQDPSTATALLIYAGLSVVLLLLLQFLPGRPMWVVEAGLLLDGVMLSYLALTRTEELALFILLPVLAVGILRGLTTGLAAGVALTLIHFWRIPGELPQISQWPPQIQVYDS